MFSMIVASELRVCLFTALLFSAKLAPILGFVPTFSEICCSYSFDSFKNHLLPSIQQSAATEIISTTLHAVHTPHDEYRRRKGNTATRWGSSGRERKKNSSSTADAFETWRVFGVEVHPDRLIKDDCYYDIDDNNNNSSICSTTHRPIHPAIMDALLARLNLQNSSSIRDIRLVRHSLDARAMHHLRRQRADGGSGPRHVFVVDIVVAAQQQRHFREQSGRMERQSADENQCDNHPPKVGIQLETVIAAAKTDFSNKESHKSKPQVVIVGAGPAGLFCALQLARTGLVRPIVLERGQPVETRGKDIGSLIHRRSLDSESNFCFGEGGAGTWSDGKLTTRIGRNSKSVRTVLETMVNYGAPEQILVEGAPHLGTDNLVRLLRNMRVDLRKMGGEIKFGTKVESLVINDAGVATGVRYCESQRAIKRKTETNGECAEDECRVIPGDAVVLATGHSARDVYEQLVAAGVQLEAKGFAVGFRVEHPQKLINKIQYGAEWAPTVVTGRKTTDVANRDFMSSRQSEESCKLHPGKLPVPSYRLATDRAFDGVKFRGCYSFCMCPGGQIVPASTDAAELCVNGMSFSRRDSLWANAALVVAINPEDEILQPYRKEYGVLAGLAFQRDMERRASIMGGGNLTVPVQRLTDFVSGLPSLTAPASSYRLGVRPSACHEIYPYPLVAALRSALTEYFDKQLPGFVCEEGLLHAVETRTSSPVRISRDKTTMQAIGCNNLYPAGEGAGFAGGIVSAAVDGMAVAESILGAMGEMSNGREKVCGGVGMFY